MSVMLWNFMADQSRFDGKQRNTVNSDFDKLEGFRTAPFADGSMHHRR